MPKGKTRYHSPVGKRLHSWNRTCYNQLQEKREKIHRDMKRQMKEDGTIENKTPFSWEWCYSEKFGTVIGFTRSEARGQIKRILDIPKKKSLPRGVQIRKVKFNEPST